ncbi:hypothetical protein DQ04_10321000 [Trypanosoma grayi]|uniref:hypothetical protein n=1 Tax=Trypanosoma grayi TaxID=71804 RepID=UPI0004F3FE19|nr:hypothetical protein DQ04_10321000 [Trypanosoma grayi]KEG07278.1 hypothetical protein DQ04_10321000 [Trypanosoma grayi]
MHLQLSLGPAEAEAKAAPAADLFVRPSGSHVAGCIRGGPAVVVWRLDAPRASNDGRSTDGVVLVDPHATHACNFRVTALSGTEHFILVGRVDGGLQGWGWDGAPLFALPGVEKRVGSTAAEIQPEAVVALSQPMCAGPRGVVGIAVLYDSSMRLLDTASRQFIPLLTEQQEQEHSSSHTILLGSGCTCLSATDTGCVVGGSRSAFFMRHSDAASGGRMTLAAVTPQPQVEGSDSEGEICCVALRPTSNAVDFAVGYSSGAVAFFHGAEGVQGGSIGPQPHSSSGGGVVAMDSAAEYVVSGGADGNAVVWLWETRGPIFTVTVRTPVRHLCLHPRGHCFATFNADGSVKVYDTHEGKVVRIRRGHNNHAADKGAFLSPLGSSNEWCSVSAQDGTLCLWAVDATITLHWPVSAAAAAAGSGGGGGVMEEQEKESIIVDGEGRSEAPVVRRPLADETLQVRLGEFAKGLMMSPTSLFSGAGDNGHESMRPPPRTTAAAATLTRAITRRGRKETTVAPTDTESRQSDRFADPQPYLQQRPQTGDSLVQGVTPVTLPSPPHTAEYDLTDLDVNLSPFTSLPQTGRQKSARLPEMPWGALAVTHLRAEHRYNRQSLGIARPQPVLAGSRISDAALGILERAGLLSSAFDCAAFTAIVPVVLLLNDVQGSIALRMYLSGLANTVRSPCTALHLLSMYTSLVVDVPVVMEKFIRVVAPCELSSLRTFPAASPFRRKDLMLLQLLVHAYREMVHILPTEPPRVRPPRYLYRWHREYLPTTHIGREVVFTSVPFVTCDLETVIVQLSSDKASPLLPPPSVSGVFAQDSSASFTPCKKELLLHGTLVVIENISAMPCGDHLFMGGVSDYVFHPFTKFHVGSSDLARMTVAQKMECPISFQSRVALWMLHEVQE